MRNVSRLFPLLPGIAMLTGCNHASQKNNGQNVQKPNIIYIFADDLGIGDLSCYGASKVSTPNIDRLAGQGVQFTNAYATSATSTPSRFGLLTGMYPWRQENTGIAPGNSELIIDTACVTMADTLPVLSANGIWDWDRKAEQTSTAKSVRMRKVSVSIMSSSFRQP